MHVFRFKLGLTALALGTLLLPGYGWAQEVAVISKEISVGRDEAALRLEFSNDRSFAVSLRHGSVFIDGESEGAFEPGDQLDAAWRALLGQAVALDDGPLSRMLVEWSPPEVLRGESFDLAETIDEALEARWLRMIEIRDEVNKAIEIKRREKFIGTGLQARVILHADADTRDFLAPFGPELPTILIVSQAEVADLAQAPEGAFRAELPGLLARLRVRAAPDGGDGG